jgi:hypothetical protein
MEEGLELAAVQVPPDPLLGMIMERPFCPAFRTTPLDTLGMLNPDIDSLIFNIQLDFTYRPWTLESEQILVQAGIAHGLHPPFHEQTLSRPATH